MRSRRAIAALGIFLGTGIASAADPSNDEQYFLEITNRMRLNPQAELQILTNINTGPPATWGTPKSDEFYTDNALTYFATNANTLSTQWSTLTAVPALAWNSILNTTSANHNAQVILYDQQSHVLPGELDVGQRYTAAGYQWTAWSENLYAFAHNNFHGHAGFAIDWGPNPDGSGIQNPPGHRNNIMSATVREAGVAIISESNPATQVGPLVITMDFGRRIGNAFLTGVVYNDTVDANHFYTPGEGIEDVAVEVYNAGTNTLRFSSTTWSSGGYTLQLPAGTYDVKISGSGIAGPITYRNVVMGSNNVKIDSLTSWLPAGGGSWTGAANWNAGVPNGIGTRAFVSSYSGTGGAIPINSAITVGSIDIDSSGFTLNGTGSLSLDVATGQSRINVAGSNHSIAVPLILNDNTTINVAGDLAITGGLQNPTAKILTRAGAGNLRIAGPQNHAPGSILAHNAGTTRLASNAGTPASAAAAAAAKLTIDITGTNSRLILESDQDLSNLTVAHASAGIQSLDLAGNVLRVYSPNLASAKSSLYSAMRNVLVTPFDGILDSTLSSHINARVGLAIIPDAHGDSHLLIRPTRAGDVNLDGTVTIADFLGLAGNFNSSGVTWQEGDLNLDGNVTIADFLELAGNFNTSYSGETFPISDSEQQLLSTFAASIGASVPEPSAISALALGALLLTSRRRRR